MQSTTITVPQFHPRHGWVDRILRVNLSDMTVCAEPAPYFPDCLGGLAAPKQHRYRAPHIGHEICSMPLRGGRLEVMDMLAARSPRYLTET